jgi:hypothetical protein
MVERREHARSKGDLQSFPSLQKRPYPFCHLEYLAGFCIFLSQCKASPQ